MAQRMKGPMTPAERQRKCRAIKRGTWDAKKSEEEKHRLGLPSIYSDPPVLMPPTNRSTAALIAPPGGPRTAAALPAPAKKELPPPASASGTAMQKAFSPNATGLALPRAAEAGIGGGDGSCLSLPPAVAARLRSLLDRHEAGKNLTAAERGEAQGLLDIAEFFVVQRLRNRLAA